VVAWESAEGSPKRVGAAGVSSFKVGCEFLCCFVEIGVHSL
jgi:hypothetical protein